MTSPKVFLIVICSFISLFLNGQDFHKKFQELLRGNDTLSQRKLLQDWEGSNSKDPELFVAYFNYYARKSKTEVVSIDRYKKNEKAFVLDDSTGKSVGYLNSSPKYNSRILQKGFEYINQGLSLYPNRLDMRFGKIYMLGEAENFSAFTKEIIETVEYGNKINNAWLWKDGKPLEDGKEFLVGSIQDYINTIYNAQDDNLLPYMRQISETVLKYSPNHVESLSNIALTYLIGNNVDYDKALRYLLKAETVAPKDVVVLNNIAEAYKKKGDKANAKIYYGKVLKVGSKEEVQDAKQKLKQL
jgi:tetratricopeptide (TPR) repeat protein